MYCMLLLQSQAREKLEQLRIANEAEVRKELEATIDDLKVSVRLSQKIKRK